MRRRLKGFGKSVSTDTRFKKFVISAVRGLVWSAHNQLLSNRCWIALVEWLGVTSDKSALEKRGDVSPHSK